MAEENEGPEEEELENEGGAVSEEEEGAEGEDASESEGAEGEEGATGASEGEGEGEPPVRTRAQTRIEALAEKARKAEERAIRAEAIAEERNNRPAAGADPEVARRAREERLATMTPEERKIFEQDEKLTKMEQQVMLTQLNTADQIDKAQYQGRAVVDAVWAKHADEVERRLHANRQRGMNFPRELILATIVGEQALKAKPKPGAKKAANERVNSVTGKPLSGRSNVATGRSNVNGARKGESLAELEERIGDVSFPSDMRF